MIANYQQPGSAIDYPNGTGSAIAAGQVVSLTTRVGVAGTCCSTGAARCARIGLDRTAGGQQDGAQERGGG